MLIDITDIQAIMPVAANIDAARYTMFIKQAETLDLKPALNADCEVDFYYYITQNFTVARIALLLDGGVYTYNSNQYSFTGLKAALALYSYARIIEGTRLQVTGDTVATLTADWSQMGVGSDIKVAAQNARAMALQYISEVKEMLCRLSSDYPEYKGNTSTRGDKGGFGVTVLDARLPRRRVIDNKDKGYGGKYY